MLQVESSPHSFVIDGGSKSFAILFEEKDQEFFKSRLDESDSPEIPLSFLGWEGWKGDIALSYAVDLAKAQDMMRSGWGSSATYAGVDAEKLNGFRRRLYLTTLRFSTLYGRYGNQLDVFHAESWFIQNTWSILIELVVMENEWLDHFPRGVCSSASAFRKNSSGRLMAFSYAKKLGLRLDLRMRAI
ncbi:hypothetical protein BGZ46_010723 [Entomortierella lignicola]|nr:hypothetical protein BGZ46_010723 [Entomortierella lignicola]